MEVGERVAFNRDTVDTENDPVSANEVGMVLAHVGQLELVEMDHGMASNGQPRVVVCEASYLRRVWVSRPGAPRRSRPRRGRG